MDQDWKDEIAEALRDVQSGGEGRVSASSNAAFQVDQQAIEAYNRIFHGLLPYCYVPDKFVECRLEYQRIEGDLEGLTADDVATLEEQYPGHILAPRFPQVEAITLFKMMLLPSSDLCFDGDVLRPKMSVFLHGPSGTGKTHLMAAYANTLKGILDQRLEYVNQHIRKSFARIYAEYDEESQKVQAGFEDVCTVELGEGEDDLFVTEYFTPEQRRDNKIKQLSEWVDNQPYKPTDGLYAAFDNLYMLHTKDLEAFEAILGAKFLFVDDVNAKNDPDREQFVQHVIERRYEMGGATIISSNQDGNEIGGSDDKIVRRLQSRMAEQFYPIDFTGCIDMRPIKGRDISALKKRIQDQCRQKGFEPISEDPK